MRQNWASGTIEFDAWSLVEPALLVDNRFAGVEVARMQRSTDSFRGQQLISFLCTFGFSYTGDFILENLWEQCQVRLCDELHELAYQGDGTTDDSFLRYNDGWNKLAGGRPFTDFNLIIGLQQKGTFRKTGLGWVNDVVRYAATTLRLDFALEELTGVESA